MSDTSAVSAVPADSVAEPCPCGSGAAFGECCGPILDGALAATAEGLMRSRYSAYAVGRIEYLRDSLHPEHRGDMDLAATRRWALEARWLGLEILGREGGAANDDEGVVEFVASYKDKGLVRRHHERANFRRYEGAWFYVDGAVVKPVTEVHRQPKVGRNDPCPCGSGRKYKKCCGH
jgi:SEC-C motif-containing protein